MTDSAYVVGPLIEARPHPGELGGLRYRIRQSLFATPANAAVTVICMLLLALVLVPFLQWALVNAIWMGTAATCHAAPQGACWAFVGAKFRFFLFGFYPTEDHWRPALVLCLSIGMLLISAVPFFWRKGLLLAWAVVIVANLVLMYGGVLGLRMHPTQIWGGLPLTMILTVVGLASAFPLGILLALGRRSKLPLLRVFCIGYIELLRGVPLITILLMASILFPLLLPEGAVIDKLLRTQVAFVMFAAAYIAEIVRGGLQAIPNGQYEAAASLGLPYTPTMLKVILPQALKIVIPPLVSTAIGFFKDTSLVIIIGLFDFFSTIKSALNDADWLGFHVEAYLFAAALYFSFCFTLSRYSLWLERRLAPENQR